MTRDESELAPGVVVIGRNEGERLRRCLESVRKQCTHVVYVDSGSRDGSVTMAREMGVDVVELDLSTPFTAGRARNAGFKRLRDLHPTIAFVQFVDGDCELVVGWIAAGLTPLLARAELAVVCGRVRERNRDASIYNRLCDLEWNTPIGETDACGGNALMRVSAFERAGGFDSTITAGEEPELCMRLQAQGFKVLRIDADMVLHDAAMTSLTQWWRRTVRTGYGLGESLARPGPAQDAELQRVRSLVVWALALPALISVGLVLAAVRSSPAAAGWIAVGAAALVFAQALRIAFKRDRPGESAGDAALYAAACMAAKPPQLLGMLRYLGQRLMRHKPRLIEYK